MILVLQPRSSFEQHFFTEEGKRTRWHGEVRYVHIYIRSGSEAFDWPIGGISLIKTQSILSKCIGSAMYIATTSENTLNTLCIYTQTALIQCIVIGNI